MEKLSDLDLIEQELSNLGLNKPREWAQNLIEKIPISNMQGFRRLNANHFSKIESLINNDFDREILLEIFKIDEKTKKAETPKSNTEYDKIVEKLNAIYLNDSQKWAKILMEKIPISNAGLLDHLQPTYFVKIESYIKNDIDRDTLKKLFNVESENKETNKERRKEKALEKKNKIEGLMKELSDYKNANKLNQQEVDTKLAAVIMELDMNPPNLKPDPESRKNMIERLQASYESIQKSGDIVEKENIDIQTLAAQVSGGNLLKGVYFLKNDLKNTIIERECLINPPTNIRESKPQEADVIDEQTTESSEEHGVYKELIKKSGNSFGVSGGGSYYGITVSASFEKSSAKQENTKTTENIGKYFFSKFKYNFCPMKKLDFNVNSLELNANAIKDLKKIEFLIESQNHQKAKSEMKAFFEKYGSHAKTGEFLLGGTFIINCNSETTTKEKTKEIMNAVSEKISIEAGVSGFGFSASGSYSQYSSQAELEKKYSKEVISTCKSSIEVYGGPKTTDLIAWRYHLSKSNADWAVISNGKKLEPVWKIIIRSHKDLFTNVYEFSNYVCKTWCEINKTEFIDENDGLFQYEIYENEKKIGLYKLNNFNDLFKEDKPKFIINLPNELYELINFKIELQKKTENINIWNTFIQDDQFKTFIRNVMTVEKELCELDDLKSILKYLNEILYILPIFWELEFTTKVENFKSSLNKKGNYDPGYSLNNINDFLNVSKELHTRLSGINIETHVKNYSEVISKFQNIFNQVLERYELNNDSRNSSEIMTKMQSVLIRIIAFFELSYDLDRGYFLYTINPYKLSIFNNKLGSNLSSYQNILSSVSNSEKKEIKSFAFLLKFIMDYTELSQYKNNQCNLIYKFLLKFFSKFPFVFKPNDFLEYANKRKLNDIINSEESSLIKPKDDYFTNDSNVNLKEITSSVTKFLEVDYKNNDKNIYLNNSTNHTIDEDNTLFKDALNLFKLEGILRASEVMVLRPNLITDQVLSIENRPIEVKNQLLIKNPNSLELLLVEKKNDANIYSDFGDDIFINDCDNTDPGNSNSDKNIIHINDIIVSLFYVSDPLVRETLSKNLSMCGKAIPFILPNREILLWQLQSITKTWRCYKEPVKSCLVTKHQSPIISFARLGDIENFSKSELINGLFFKKNNVFINKNITYQQSPPKVSQGLIEISWYCPEHNIANDLDNNNPITFDKNMITIMNLRGDANKNHHQLDVLRKVSDLLVILVSDKNQLDNAKFSNDDPNLIVIAKDPKGITGVPDRRIALKVPDVNDSFLNKFKAIMLKNLFQVEKKLKKLTLDNVANIAIQNKNIKYLLDLNDVILSNTLIKAKEFMEMIKGKKKNQIFYLGGSESWGKYVNNEKRINSLINESHNTISLEEVRSNLINANVKIREDQQKTAADQNSPIWKFIQNLLSFDKEERTYYIEWINILLNERNSHELSPLIKERNEYLNKQTQSNDKNEYKDELNEIGNKICEIGFGIEQIIREIGQIYECFTSELSNDYNEFKKSLKILPIAFAELCLRGLSLEILDGDTSFIPVTWVSDIFTEISNIVKDKKIGICSILGTQSTGKSTFLNALFNFKFAVAAERCTKGMYMKIIKVDESFEDNKIDYLMVLDTEGLRAPELITTNTTNYKRDNEMATTVIGLSDLTMINMMKLYNPSIMEILNIVVHAVLKIKNNTSANITPKCMFVHQDVKNLDDPKKVNAEAKKKLKDSLDTMTNEAAKFLGIGKTNFYDVIPNDSESDKYIDPLFEGSSFNASISSSYVKSTQEIKYDILKSINSKSQLLTFEHMANRLKNLWNAVLQENFTFAFVNTFELNAYNHISETYNKYLQEFSSDISKNSVDWKDRLYNKHLTDSVFYQEFNLKTSEYIVKYTNDFDKFIENNSRNNEYYMKEKDSTIKSIQKTISQLLGQVENEINAIFKQKSLRVSIDGKFNEIEKEMFDEAKKFHKSYKGKLKNEELEEKFNKEVWQNVLNKFAGFLNKIVTTDKDPVNDAINLIKKYENKDSRTLNLILINKWPYSKVSEIIKMDSKNIQQHYENKNFLDKAVKYFNNSRANNAFKELENLERELENKLNDQNTKTSYEINLIIELLKYVDEYVEKNNKENDFTYSTAINIYLSAKLLDKKLPLYMQLVLDETKRNDPRQIIDSDLKPKIIRKLKLQFDSISSIDKSVTSLVDLFKKKVKEKITSDFRNMKVKDIIYANKSCFKTKAQLLKETLEDILTNKEWVVAKVLCRYGGFIQASKNFIKRIIEKTINDDLYELQDTLQSDLKNIVEFIMTSCVKLVDKQNFRDFFEFLKTDLCRKDTPEEYRIYLNDTDYEEIITDDENIFFDENLKKEFKIKLVNQLKEKFENFYVKDNCNNYKKEFAFRYSDIDEISKKIEKCSLGCTNCCPYCGSPCQKTVSGHADPCETKFHLYHGIQGRSRNGTDNLLNNITCNGLVKSDLYLIYADGKKEPFRDYKQYHPDWTIIPDDSLNEAPFFQWFIGHFDTQILQFFDRTGWTNDIRSWKNTSYEFTAKKFLQSYV